MALLPGATLENRYRIQGLLAQGGMSTVYRAFDTNLQIEVALKENEFTTPEAVEQFQREALLLARLRHPGLPRVLQHLSYQGRQYLVMEFIEGLDLWQIIRQQGKPFNEAQALGYIEEVCQAVIYLHSQSPPIIHRDIKPQNIKVTPADQVVLVDFGVAKQGNVHDQTAAGARGVTPGFSPPEQYSGAGTSPAADIYSLGATLYALLTATKPPDSVSLAIGQARYLPPEQINPAISQGISLNIAWAMQPKPTDRPKTVGDWLKKLRQATSQFSAPLPEETSLPVSAPFSVKPPNLEKPTTAGVLCLSCKTLNRPGVRFCEMCGVPLQSTAAPQSFPPSATSLDGQPCPFCGKLNRAGVSFCEHCGKSLSFR